MNPPAGSEASSKKIVVGITGASGAAYAVRVIELLCQSGVEVHVTASDLGRRLLAEELGIDRTDCYITNVVKCRPPENRDPRPDEIAACRPYLEQQVALVDPAVIVTLGNFSSKLLLETDVGITKLRGRSYRFGDPERHLVPTFHPAAALRGGADVLARMRADLVRAKVLMGDR